jgi:hypothetical protein
MLIYINFSNPWPKSLGSKYPIWKNHEIQFLINQMLKERIEKNIYSIIEYSKQKISIKRMIIKIEIQFFYYFWLKYEIEKKNQLKKNKTMRIKIKIKNTGKFLI